MIESDGRPHPLNDRLVDELYTEAMILADEARAYLERGAEVERALLDPVDRVHFSCEALKVTTRLMQVIAWLLTRRAVLRGEIDLAESRSEKYRLGDAAPSDGSAVTAFPADMRILIAMSESLYLRAQRLEDKIVAGAPTGAEPGHSPARDLIDRLESAF